jgi:hypothetical protein
VKKNEVGVACDTHGREKSVQGFGGKPEGKRSLGRSRRKWEDGIRIDLGDIGWGVEWNHSLQDRGGRRTVVNTEMTFRVT